MSYCDHAAKKWKIRELKQVMKTVCYEDDHDDDNHQQHYHKQNNTERNNNFNLFFFQSTLSVQWTVSDMQDHVTKLQHKNHV